MTGIHTLSVESFTEMNENYITSIQFSSCSAINTMGEHFEVTKIVNCSSETMVQDENGE